MITKKGTFWNSIFQNPFEYSESTYKMGSRQWLLFLTKLWVDNILTLIILFGCTVILHILWIFCTGTVLKNMINIKNVRTIGRYRTVRKEWMLIYFLQIPKTYVPVRTHNRGNTNFSMWFYMGTIGQCYFSLALTNLRTYVPGSLRWRVGVVSAHIGTSP